MTRKPLTNVHSDYWTFGDLKKRPQGKTFDTNEEVIAVPDVYFEDKGKLCT